MSINYKKCPKCGSKNSVRIIYGLPSYELMEEARQGKVQLGGCIVMEGCPEYFCKDCEHKWNREQIIDQTYNEINIIKVSVGGFFGPQYDIELNLRDNQLIWNGMEDGFRDSLIKAMNEEEMKMIIQQLIILNILDWRSKYIEPSVCDGTQWDMEIVTDKKTIHKHGSNKYPREWDRFCRFIQEITGKLFE